MVEGRRNTPVEEGGTGSKSTYRKMRKISSISESPGNSGWRMIISAKMHPTLHMSTPVE